MLSCKAINNEKTAACDKILEKVILPSEFIEMQRCSEIIKF